MKEQKQDIDRSNEGSIDNRFSGLRIDKKNVGNEIYTSLMEIVTG